MIAASWLWIVFTLLAAAGQTARNAMQRELVAALGTVGATDVRFLFGFPFALIFLAVSRLSQPASRFRIRRHCSGPGCLVGAGTQILATALMLMAMNDRSFVVTIVYQKTEVIQAAVFGLLFLGDPLTLPILAAIVIATVGVVLMSLKGNASFQGGLRPTLFGIASGTMLALSATGFRGAILTLGLPDFVLAATFTLATGLLLQSALLSLYLAVRDRNVLLAIVRAWRPSLFAGLMGGTASQFWFLAFALTSVANVRTVGLAEVLFAQAISIFIFKQATTAREALGMALIVAGVAILLGDGESMIPEKPAPDLIRGGYRFSKKIML